MAPLPPEITQLSTLPGWRHLALNSVGSTNDEAMELAKAGDAGRIWVSASQQTAGKARRGRNWVSNPGNLYASLLLIDPAPSDQLATLPLVISLALHKAVAAAAPQLESGLLIKWPNDLLLAGNKLSGILLEAVQDPFDRLAVVIGCGVNCRHFPEKNPLYPATSLAAQGVDVDPQSLFQHLARCVADELRIWSQGAGFSIIRREWLYRAAGKGKPVTARFSDHEISGRFVDLDQAGFLMLEDTAGKIHKISAADIFFGESVTKGA